MSCLLREKYCDEFLLSFPITVSRMTRNVCLFLCLLFVLQLSLSPSGLNNSSFLYIVLGSTIPDQIASNKVPGQRLPPGFLDSCFLQEYSLDIE